MEISSITISPYDAGAPSGSFIPGTGTAPRAVSRNGKGGEGDDRAIQQEIQKLKAQEEKVKAHEAAHKSAGGQYAGAVSYTYRPGPDGKSYIVGGEVQIDISPGKTPEETIRKMAIVQRAALAPADPSGQDRAVAAQAASLAAQAQQELARGEGGRNGSAPAGESRTDQPSPVGSAGNGYVSQRDGVAAYRLLTPSPVRRGSSFSLYA